MDRGLVWSAIRSRLSTIREDLKAAVSADKYEIESAYFDSIARDLADAVLVKLAGED